MPVQAGVRVGARVEAPAQQQATPGAHAGVHALGTVPASGGHLDSAVHAKDSSYVRIPGSPSQSAQALAAYKEVQDFIAKYPTEAALKAAGFTSDQGGNHYNVLRRGLYDDGQTRMAHVIVEKGKVVGAQFDSESRQLNDPPPAWAGVQWHYHDHGKSGWMFHVRVDKPFEQAFIEVA